MKPNQKKTLSGTDAFKMLGGLQGVRTLADNFYDIMTSLPEAQKIRDMHPADLATTRENFTLFVCGWLGGPPLYKEKHGPIDLTKLHALLDINEAERDMWLSCMERALNQLEIPEEGKQYLLERFRQPAGKICNWCQKQFLQSPGAGSLRNTIKKQ